MGKKHPYYGRIMSTNFLGRPHTVGFVAFSRTMGNWWENTCISHMIKCENQMGKKVSILWEKYDYQFPWFSPYDGFCCIFPYYGKLKGKPMHFPHDEVYDRMGMGWEKSTHTMGNVRLPISQVLPIRWVLLHFPMHWETDGKTYPFLIWQDSLTFSCDRWLQISSAIFILTLPLINLCKRSCKNNLNRLENWYVKETFITS